METRKNGQLYIDGQLVDIDDNTKITLNIVSNIFRDVSKIQCNVTYTIKLPKTVRNQRIFGHSDMVQGGNGYPYKLHPARYLRNGVEIIRNGSAALLSTTDKSFEVSVVWGLFPAFSKLLANGMTLNQLESDAKIMYEDSNAMTDYATALTEGYFYAGFDVWAKSDEVDYSWRNGRNTLNVDGGRASSSTGRLGGGYISVGRRGTEQKVAYLHPSVRVSWLLDQIKSQTGVEFRWTGDSKTFIDSLIIPLIHKKANALTYEGQFAASMKAQNGAGFITLNVTTGTNIFRETTGTEAQVLTVAANAEVVFDVAAEMSYDVTGIYNNYGKAFTRDVPYIVMKVTRGNDVTEYSIGDSRGGVMNYDSLRAVNFVIRQKMKGYGAVELKAGDKITFELKGGYRNNVLYSGSIATFIADNGDEVPSGGYFPIVENLPEIKVLDLVKFLASITGTFPVQRYSDGVVLFVPMSEIWQNVDKAKDWTRRVIAPSEQNTPMQMTFKMTDYAQHNYYKWKSDDKVKGNYNGDLFIENETLDIEKTIFEFPFAASDGDCVPMYGPKATSSGGSFGGSSSGSASSSDTTVPYSACEPRILRLVEGDNGKAYGEFDINMQDVINEKYADMVRSLQLMKIIKESIRVSDVELLQFDETVPVYLAQYGSYFAITEIKAEDDGMAEVTMLQLNLH